MLRPSDYAPGLLQQAEGLWVSQTTESISYHEEANHNCMKFEDQSFWFRHRNDCILAVFRNFPSAGPVFDLGGGNGIVSLALKRAGVQAVVVEPGKQGAINALSRGLSPVICATLDSAGFAKNSLPAVGVFDVVEHLEDDIRFLKSIRESLSPQGRIYLTVPAYRALWSEEDDAAGHFHRYTRRQMKSTLSQAGFEMEYGTYFFSFLILPIFLFRTLPYKLGIRRANSPQEHAKDHTGRSAKVFVFFLSAMLRLELFLLRQRFRLPLGGSILAVARPRSA